MSVNITCKNVRARHLKIFLFEISQVGISRKAEGKVV